MSRRTDEAKNEVALVPTVLTLLTVPRMPRLVCLVAGIALAVGFAVAELTGVRAFGGVVLVLAGAWCARQWWRSAGPRRAVAGEAVFVAAFVIAHPLGRAIGAWAAVLVVSIATVVLTYRITARAA